MFESYKKKFQDFADEQKVERLKGCKLLEEQLKECHRYREALLKSSDNQRSGVGLVPDKENSGSKSPWWPWKKATGNNMTEHIEASKVESISDIKQQELNIKIESNAAGKTEGNIEKTEQFKRPAMWRGSAPAITRKVLNNSKQDNQKDAFLEVKEINKNLSSSISSQIPSCEEEAHVLWRCRGLALGCGEHIVRLKKCFNGELDGDCKQEQIFLGKCVKENAIELEKRRRETKSRLKETN